MKTDRFGNPMAADLPYARGSILKGTEEDFIKIRKAWRIVGKRLAEKGKQSIYNFTGLERSLSITPEDAEMLDDEVAPAKYFERFRKAALEHLGGNPAAHDAALFNRTTAATLATFLALVKPGEAVIGVSASHSHPSIVRAAALVGARFVDTAGVQNFKEALEAHREVGLVVLTRLAVTYEILSTDEIREIIKSSKVRGALVYIDDAGGARVGPAVFNQPKMLELGVDAGVTGLDKYGCEGPRLGLLGGAREVVEKIRARALEFGLEARPLLFAAAARSLEAYRPHRVRELVATTRRVASELRAFFGKALHETPVTAQLKAEDVLEIAMRRAGLTAPPLVPYEATAALAMILLEDYGILTVHFAGLPPGTADVLFKFIPPEVLEEFGGPRRFAEAVSSSMDRLARIIHDPEEVKRLLFE